MTASSWVADALGLTVELDLPGGAAADPMAALDTLAGLALRRNPRRAHLLVSRVLGKHLPVDPAVALQAAADLADRIQAVTRGQAPPLVLGFAETATALGQAVAAALPDAECVLSTRRPGRESISFAEEHSHATGHRVLAPAATFEQPRPVLLVDDELSSGRTAINTIRALHERSRHPSYVVAALLDLRPRQAREQFDKLAAELGAPVQAVSLLSGALDVPADAPERVAGLISAAAPPLLLPAHWPAAVMRADWPAGVKLGARRGWDRFDEAALEAALEPLVGRLISELPEGAERVLVLGTEELMYAPLKLAAALAARSPRTRVRYQSTTRSPVAPLDREGYAVRCALAFAAPDEPGRQSFVYNVRPGIADHVLVVTDGGETGPMRQALSGVAPVTEVLLADEVTPR